MKEPQWSFTFSFMFFPTSSSLSLWITCLDQEAVSTSLQQNKKTFPPKILILNSRAADKFLKQQNKENHSYILGKIQFSSVQLLSHVRLFATPWTAARQASLSITKSWNLLKLMSIESVMPSNHLVLCCPLLLLPLIFKHQGLLQWVSSSHQVVNVLEFRLQRLSFKWIFRTDFL